MNNRTGKTIRVLDNKIWKEFKKTYPPKKYDCADREELKKIVKEIFKVISEKLVKSKAGVIISGFGYLFNWKIPKKMQYSLTPKGKNIIKKYNYYTDMYMYSPLFLPNSTFEGWSMDHTFNDSLKQDLKENLQNGKKYKMYLYSFKNLLY